jgi:hypothetical protein
MLKFNKTSASNHPLIEITAAPGNILLKEIIFT